MAVAYKAWYGAPNNGMASIEELKIFDSSGNTIWYGYASGRITASEVTAGTWTRTATNASNLVQNQLGVDSISFTVYKDSHIILTIGEETYRYSLGGYTLGLNGTVESGNYAYYYIPTGFSGATAPDYSGAYLFQKYTSGTIRAPVITSVSYSNGTASVEWSHVPTFGNAVYRLYYSRYASMSDAVNLEDTTSHSANVSGLTADIGGYYWRVVAEEETQTTIYVAQSEIYYNQYSTGGSSMSSNNDIPAFSNIKLMQTPTDNNHAARLVDVDNKITALGVGTISSNISTHVADTSVHVPVQNSAGYVFLSDTTATSSGTWTAYTTSVTQNSTALVTSGAVWSAINALSTTYAASSHTHAASAITSGTLGSARLPAATTSAKGAVQVGEGLSIASEILSVSAGNGIELDATTHAVTIKLDSSSGLTVSSSGLKVNTSSLATLLGLGTAAYVDTGAMTGTSADSGKAAVLNSSGKIASSALPSANGSSVAGIVTQGNGVTITSGSLTVKAGNGISVGSGGVAIKLDTNSGLSVSSNGLKVDTTNLATILSLGTAAEADTGTEEGNVPVLDSNGKLATSVLPSVAITDTFVASTQAAMLLLAAQKGDVCVRTDLNKSFILAEEGATTLSHWQELLTPTDTVTSVNGSTGAVSITLSSLGGLPSSYLETTLTSTSDVKVPSSKAVATYVSNNAIPSSYLETTLTTSSDVNVPSSKAVYTYVNTNYAAKTHNHAAGDINSGTLGSARLPAATTSAKGAVIVGGGLKVSSGTVSIDFLAASNGTYDTTNDSKAITAKAAKSIADTAAATAAKGYAGTITGDGSTTAFDVTHNLGTANILVQIYDTDGDPCLVSYTRATNKITVNFASAPANNASFAVMIIAVS